MVLALMQMIISCLYNRFSDLFLHTNCETGKVTFVMCFVFKLLFDYIGRCTIKLPM